MKSTHRKAITVFALMGSLFATHSEAQKYSASELESRMVERRAVDAAIWGMPIVSFDAIRQAYFRDAKANYNDIIWWPKNSGWKNQTLTINTSVRYLYFFLNTKDDGPIVIELPSAVNGSGFYGTITDAWQLPLIDIGGSGKAGKYLVLPPDYSGEPPAGFTPVRPATNNLFIGLRSIVASLGANDIRTADSLVKQIRIYPLAKAANPRVQKLIDMTDILFDGLIHYDESIYTSLARMLNEEPIQPRDLQMMGLILPLGISKGKEFNPDASTVSQLKAAAEETHAYIMNKLITFISPWWAGSQWAIPVDPIAVKTMFQWEIPNYFDVDSRGIAYATFFCPPTKLGGGSFYLAANLDNKGERLNGNNTYRFHVPANVPVSQFWSVTVYSVESQAIFLNSNRISLDSYNKEMKRNADGSVDLYFGSKAPKSQEANWIETPSGKYWFPWFRFYGPEKPLFDKSWKMPDIEKM